MAHFIRSFSRRLPECLHHISDSVYVLDSCLSTNEMSEEDYKAYMDAAVSSLYKHQPNASFMVFNFREGDGQSLTSTILSEYDMTVVDYPIHYVHKGDSLLPLGTIQHFLRSSQGWLSLENQKNMVLVHCESGGWPALAFMLAGLLLYANKSSGERKTLEMLYNKAPKELLSRLSPVDPRPSQLRYLEYISDWRSLEAPLVLESLVLSNLPVSDSGEVCRPVVRVYGHDPTMKLLFTSLKEKEAVSCYHEEVCLLVELNISCRVQGDVFLECVYLGEGLATEETIFRIMFHTAFVESNVLRLGLEEVDALWDAKSKFSKDFKAEVLFSSYKEGSNSNEEESEGEEDACETDSEFFEAEEFEILNYSIKHIRDDDDGDYLAQNADIMYSVESFKEVHLDDEDIEGISDASSVENIVIVDNNENLGSEGSEGTITNSRHVAVFDVSLEQDPELALEADYDNNQYGQDCDAASDTDDESHQRANNRKTSLEYEDQGRNTRRVFKASYGSNITQISHEMQAIDIERIEDRPKAESEVSTTANNIAVVHGSQELQEEVKIESKQALLGQK